jgi:hypothetical protein
VLQLVKLDCVVDPPHNVTHAVGNLGDVLEGPLRILLHSLLDLLDSEGSRIDTLQLRQQVGVGKDLLYVLPTLVFPQ